ncbi:MAG: hypothetical protein KME17_13490 [Cyanosarcina radialis HA8281-LM2]|jgi:hypothetical protein|nr:hypothetical protein [Cyanosarcina radialis HA8281-LM2]
MASEQAKSNEPHDQFIKQFIPVVLKNLFESQTSVSVRLSEELAIDVLCTAIKHDGKIEIDDSLGLLGRLVAIHSTIIIEHYSGYLDLEDIDSCILRSGLYWELNKSKSDNSRKIRATKNSVTNPTPLHFDRPFTWILTAKCGENSFKRWNAIPYPEYGAHVYRLAAPGLSMGIVDIESLPYNPDTMLLKMLGKANSAKQAFADILKLDPKLELRNDIIEVSLKHCIYLEEVKSELTQEALSFMTYLKEVEEAYQAWVKKRQAEGKIVGFEEGKIEGIREGKIEGIREGKIEGIREGKVEGIREGKVEGIREGKVEGVREGMIRAATKIVRGKFGVEALTPEISDRITGLSDRQLDEFTSKIFDWQQPSEMVAWLENCQS